MSSLPPATATMISNRGKRSRREDDEIDALVFPVCRKMWASTPPTEPQTRLIRPVLSEQGHAIGSNSIQRSLDRWRVKEKPQPVVVPSEPIPPVLARAVIETLTHERTAAREELQQEVQRLRTDKEDVLAGYDQANERISDLSEEIETLRHERDTVAGELNSVSTQRDGLQRDLAQARSQAEELRLKLAEENFTERQRIEELERLRTDHARLLEQLDSERARFQTQVNTERDARIEAQRQQAILETRATDIGDRITDLQERETAARDTTDELRGRFDTLSGELRAGHAQLVTITGEAKAAQASVERLTAELIEVRADLTRTRDSLERSLRELGEVRGELTECRRENQQLSVQNAQLGERITQFVPKSGSAS